MIQLTDAIKKMAKLTEKEKKSLCWVYNTKREINPNSSRLDPSFITKMKTLSVISEEYHMVTLTAFGILITERIMNNIIDTMV